MKYSHVLLFLMVGSLAFFISGCSGRPTDSIQKTEQARTEAAAEHADQFAPDFWSAGEKSWQEANAKLDSKSYGEAGNLLLKAKTNYIKARDSARSKREAAIKEIADLQGTVAIRLKRDLTDNPAANQLSAARKKEYEAAIKQIEDGVAKAAVQLKEARYTDAKYLLGKALRDVYETQQEYLKK